MATLTAAGRVTWTAAGRATRTVAVRAAAEGVARVARVTLMVAGRATRTGVERATRKAAERATVARARTTAEVLRVPRTAEHSEWRADQPAQCSTITACMHPCQHSKERQQTQHKRRSVVRMRQPK